MPTEEAGAKPKRKRNQRHKRAGRGAVFEPTHDDRVKVEVLAANGFTHAMIATELEVSEDTIERHFADELKSGNDRLVARVGATVAQQALEGCRKSQRLFLDRRGGDEWKPRSALEHSGPGGKPIETRDMSKLTPEQLAALAALDDGDQ